MSGNMNMQDMDITVLLAMINKIANKYELDYDEVIKFCGLNPPKKQPLSEVIDLELITISGNDYLYNFNDTAVYQKTKNKMKHVGYLCQTTFKIISRRT